MIWAELFRIPLRVFGFLIELLPAWVDPDAIGETGNALHKLAGWVKVLNMYVNVPLALSAALITLAMGVALTVFASIDYVYKRFPGKAS